jgi:hypothetical protein
MKEGNVNDLAIRLGTMPMGTRFICCHYTAAPPATRPPGPEIQDRKVILSIPEAGLVLRLKSAL